MDEFEKRTREAGEAYATGNHSVSFADTADQKAFEAGANWARAVQLKQPGPGWFKTVVNVLACLCVIIWLLGLLGFHSGFSFPLK